MLDPTNRKAKTARHYHFTFVLASLRGLSPTVYYNLPI